MNKLLLIIDPQVDFITGSLPIQGAAEAMNNLSQYISEHGKEYTKIIITADRHPFDHCSFKECGGVWPMHCVHDTVGAAIWTSVFDAAYRSKTPVEILYKGQEADKEEYSIFQNQHSASRIREIVDKVDISQIDICGLAGDICVLQSLKDGKEYFGADRFNLLTDFSPCVNPEFRFADSEICQGIKLTHKE